MQTFASRIWTRVASAMWAWWASLDMDPNLGPGTYAWLLLKLDSKFQCYAREKKVSMMQLGGPAEAGDLTASSLPLLDCARTSGTRNLRCMKCLARHMKRVDDMQIFKKLLWIELPRPKIPANTWNTWRIGNTHLRNYYNLKGKDIDVPLIPTPVRHGCQIVRRKTAARR